MALEEYKQSIIEHMDFGIKHTDLQDAYSIGFRNGIRWCKSLIDGVEPIYESVADTMYYPQVDGITPSVIIADTPQTALCRECDDYAGDGMYCASNYLVRDFSTSAENCETERNK